MDLIILLMLCLGYQNIIDGLEEKFFVETIREWKMKHQRRVSHIFSILHFENDVKKKIWILEEM